MGGVRAWGAAAAVLLALPAAAPAAVTRHELPRECEAAFHDADVAFACDPAGRATHVRLTLGSLHSPTRHDGVAAIESDEPLQPGETLTLNWDRPSAGSVLYVRAFAPGFPRGLIFDLHARPARVDVLPQQDGSVEVRTPAGTSAVPPPAPLPSVTWNATTPRAAATAVLAALDHIERWLAPSCSSSTCPASLRFRTR